MYKVVFIYLAFVGVIRKTGDKAVEKRVSILFSAQGFFLKRAFINEIEKQLAL